MKILLLKLGNFRDRHFLFITTLMAMLGGLLFGFGIAVVASAILFIDHQFSLSPIVNGIIVGSILIGAAVGSIVSNRLVNYYGRRKTIINVILLFIVGCIGIYFSSDVFSIIISRVVLGFALGVTSFAIPLYIIEVLPLRFSSRVVVFNQLFITLGATLAYFAGYFFAESENWHLLMASGIIPAVLLLLTTFTVPESPKWLLMKERDGDAWRVLRRIRNSFDIDVELSEMKEKTRSIHRDWHILLKKWVLPIVILGFGISIIRQFSGFNAIVYYMPTVLQMSGFESESQAILITAVLGTLSVLFSFVTLPLVHSCRRRPLFILGLFGMALSWGVLSLAFWLCGSQSEVLKWLTLSSFVLYIPSFAISLGVLVFVFIYELFPLRIRSIATSYAISINWILNIIVTSTFVYLMRLLTPSGVFGTYGLICVLGLLFVYFKVPETRGVDIDRIENNLRLGKKGRALVD